MIRPCSASGLTILDDKTGIGRQIAHAAPSQRHGTMSLVCAAQIGRSFRKIAVFVSTNINGAIYDSLFAAKVGRHP